MKNKINNKKTTIMTSTALMTLLALLFVPTAVHDAGAIEILTYEFSFGDFSNRHGGGAISFDDLGYAYILDGTTGNVTKWSNNGMFVTSWQGPLPVNDLVADSAGNTYHAVYDNGNRYIAKYDTDGVPIHSWPVGNQSQTGLAYDKINDLIYYGHREPNTIDVYAINGTKITSFMTGMYSAYLYVDDNADLYVGNPGADLKKFDRYGKLLGEWDLDSEVDESFFFPSVTDMTVEGDKIYLITTDRDFPRNEYVMSFDPITNKTEQLHKSTELLRYLEFAPNGSLYVVDNFEVEAYSLSELVTLFCGEAESSYEKVIHGTNSADYLKGTEKADLIFGYGGGDFIRGLGGDDCIFAGDGDDVIYSESKKGTNTVDGGEGTDMCITENEKVSVHNTSCEITS